MMRNEKRNLKEENKKKGMALIDSIKQKLKEENEGVIKEKNEKRKQTMKEKAEEEKKVKQEEEKKKIEILLESGLLLPQEVENTRKKEKQDKLNARNERLRKNKEQKKIRTKIQQNLLEEQQREEALQRKENMAETVCSYLDSWKNSKESWKFKKVLQSKMILGCYSKSMIPDDHFRTFEEYIGDLKGSQRDAFLKCANEAKQDPNSQPWQVERAKRVIQALNKN
eukprot:TRINITY_DN5405_c0_g1_i2.p1 TRINITY_DN5405_c0_g1~~TRINITY_DN5405_c0_g1_i2.p1  ORF type:complete len:225 (+),score=90.68 TRINITY_DN5405_c0_g1_i2:537-1211(+)